MERLLEANRSGFSLLVGATIEGEASVIEAEVDHTEIEEDTETDPMIMEIVHLGEISGIDPEAASTVEKKDT
jgi:hypothetical protein